MLITWYILARAELIWGRIDLAPLWCVTLGDGDGDGVLLYELEPEGRRADTPGVVHGEQQPREDDGRLHVGHGYARGPHGDLPRPGWRRPVHRGAYRTPRRVETSYKTGPFLPHQMSNAMGLLDKGLLEMP